MPNTLLSTKLYIPRPHQELVHRPPLIERLDTGLHGRLTLVSAPAGCGKTTLVSDWIARSEIPAAWLSEANDDVMPNTLLFTKLYIPPVRPDPSTLDAKRPSQDKVGVAPTLEPVAESVHGWQATGASFVERLLNLSSIEKRRGGTTESERGLAGEGR